MDYEIFYQEYVELEKKLKDNIKSLNRFQKALSKHMTQGEIKLVSQDITNIKETNEILETINVKLEELIGTFNAKDYIESGDWTNQMLDCCRTEKIDVQGTFPVYEMFPFKVRIDSENQDIFIDRKKFSNLRPSFFVNQVSKMQDKLNKASFNAVKFASELAICYDRFLILKGKKIGSDVYLLDLYALLVPMGRFRTDYNKQSFAFDIARLRRAGEVIIKDGRKVQLGSSRNENKAIRVLNEAGLEEFFSTIVFV
ncbi:MAG: hypothetical protein WC162_05955 [Sphaerochaetaceae bacterium]|nr:hypothetical protein [Sphaerochaetaceae bacterium]